MLTFQAVIHLMRGVVHNLWLTFEGSPPFHHRFVRSINPFVHPENEGGSGGRRSIEKRAEIEEASYPSFDANKSRPAKIGRSKRYWNRVRHCLPVLLQVEFDPNILRFTFT